MTLDDIDRRLNAFLTGGCVLMACFAVVLNRKVEIPKGMRMLTIEADCAIEQHRWLDGKYYNADGLSFDPARVGEPVFVLTIRCLQKKKAP